MNQDKKNSNLLIALFAIPKKAYSSIKTSVEKAPPHLLHRSALLLTAIFFVFGAIAGYKYFSYRTEFLRRQAELAAGPLVKVSIIKKSLGEHRINLIGETRPFNSATMYAKVSGYLKKILVDKGDVVKEGQILAVIESPETDAAYLAAEADAKNKKSILSRIEKLYQKKLVSEQEYEQAEADSNVATARFKTQQTIKSYETLRAPFAGTITSRFADPGALVQNASSSETSSLPIVMVSQVDRLRIDIFIDQKDAFYVQKDEPVTISLPERPDFKLEGKIARMSGELDPRTKMLLTEIDIPNENGALVAGSFVQVSLLIRTPAFLEAPVEALSLKGDKSFLTIVGPDNRLIYKAIEIASNDGKNLSVSSGVEEGSRVALNIGSSLPEGSKVRPVDEIAQGVGVHK